MDFKELMTTTEYDFLRDNPRLGDRIKEITDYARYKQRNQGGR